MRKKTHDEFVQEVYSLTQGEYGVISTYVGNKVKVKMLHKVCNRIFEITPSNFIQGYRCSKCAKRVIRTCSEFKSDIEQITNGEYEALSSFVKTNKKVAFLHKTCNTVFNMTPNHFLRGVRCPACSWNSKKTTEAFIAEVEKLSNGEYAVMSEYKGRQYKITMRHNACGNIWETTPGHFLKGIRCPICNESKGELKVREILMKHGLQYKRQYIIKGCKNKGYMPFDFAVFNGLKRLLFLCEFQGMQHYKAVDFFGGLEAFNKLQSRDRLKKEFCIKNKIPLLTISYKEVKSIEEIIMAFIQEVSAIGSQ